MVNGVRLVLLGLLLTCVSPVWAVDSRSHEPSLHELAAELDGMRQLTSSRLQAIRELLDERDKLYSERANAGRVAVDAALTATKEQTASSFAANKESVSKYEQAQHEYNLRTNEFRGQLEDQAKRLIPRAEVESIVKNLEEKTVRLEADIRIIREQMGTDVGRGAGMAQFWGYIVTILGLLFGVASAFGVTFYLSRKSKE